MVVDGHLWKSEVSGGIESREIKSMFLVSSNLITFIEIQHLFKIDSLLLLSI
ncbi:MAG: hypothetical protein ACJAXJ_004488 [Colwellia sp.]|jgi:hypothetical protein